MIRRNIILILFAVISFSNFLFGQEDERWVNFENGEDGKFYVDKETIDYDKTFNKYTMWIKYILNIPKYDNNKGKYIKYTVTIWEMHCDTRYNNETEKYIYYEDGEYYNYKINSGGYKIPPESVAETLYNIICK